MPSTPFGNNIGGYTPAIPYAQTVSPMGNSGVLGRVLGLTAGGVLQSNVGLSVPSLQVGSGSSTDIIINGANISVGALNLARLSKIADAGTEVVEWDPSVNVYSFDATSTATSKTTTFLAEYVDGCGTHYGLMKTTYNADLQLGDSTEFLRNYLLSQNLELASQIEVVVIGFTFDANYPNIVIPNHVSIPEGEHAGTYPVREIWGGQIYGSVGGSDVHALALKEMIGTAAVANVPAAFYAPYITKISIKRRIYQSYFLFSGISPLSIHMPNLRRVVGAGPQLMSPIFTSLNGSKSMCTELVFPSLQEIKYAIFGCNNNRLTTVLLPALEEIHESVFLRGLPLVTKLEFPRLKVIQGCDYFIANCYNLKELHFPTYIRLQPHIWINTTTATTVATYDALVRGTLQLLAIDAIYSASRRYNNTNAMAYFLHADTKLMNASGSTTTPASSVLPPFDTPVKVTAYEGIYFDLYNWNSSDEFAVAGNAQYGFCIETADQWANRTGNAPLTSISGTEQVVGNVTYLLESTYNMLLANATLPTAINVASKIDTTANPAPTGASVIIVPVDPRTALFNAVTVTPGRTTSVHNFNKNDTEIRFVENSDCYGLAGDANKTAVNRRSFLWLCLGENQYYNFAVAAAAESPTD